MEQVKPRVFIASSVEGLLIAEAINSNLDHATFPTLWKDGTFHLGSHSLDDLVKKSSQVDFAVFVFTADDVLQIREKQTAAVRDNVLFELGLFVGAIGKDRCYIVRPRGTELHLPSDLLGITTADYATDRGDNDWFSALNAPCTKIKAEIAHLGMFRGGINNGANGVAQPVANPTVYAITPWDLKVLACVAQSHVAIPDGVSFSWISRDFNSASDAMVSLALTKLLKRGCIEKAIAKDMDGDTIYLYSITEDGVELFLEHEAEFVPPPPPRPVRKGAPAAFGDDEIPF